jgi:hypothetical protein
VSHYGMLWQKASEIRERLKSLMPGVLGHNFTPADAKLRAREQMTKFVARVDMLVAEWEALEREMAQEPDDR